MAQGHESGRCALLEARDPQATDDRPTARSRDKPRTAARGFGKGLPLRSLLLPLALPWIWASPLYSVFLAVVQSTIEPPGGVDPEGINAAKPKALSVLMLCPWRCFNLRGVKGGDCSMGALRAASRGRGSAGDHGNGAGSGAWAVDALSPGLHYGGRCGSSVLSGPETPPSWGAFPFAVSSCPPR